MPNVSNLIKTIQDIMRKDAGVDGDAQRLAQLGWMFFLKIFDDREKEMEVLRDNYKSPLPNELRWSNWATDEEGITGDALLAFANNDLLPRLKVLYGSGDIVMLIKAAFDGANNYMKNGTLMRQVINKINGIDFNASDDRHMFGDIYEKLLKDLQSAGNAGEFYTPRAVTQFIVEQVNPCLGETILDPACGTGGFLVCAIEHLRKQAKNEAHERTIQGGAIATNKKRLVKTPIFVDSNTMAMICPPFIELRYLHIWFSGIDLWKLNRGTSVPQINNKDISPLVIPVPPVAEQRRIVAKVERLMALVDALESQLATSRATAKKLLAAIVAELTEGTNAYLAR